jgi:hypothetical protein
MQINPFEMSDRGPSTLTSWSDMVKCTTLTAWDSREFTFLSNVCRKSGKVIEIQWMSPVWTLRSYELHMRSDIGMERLWRSEEKLMIVQRSNVSWEMRWWDMQIWKWRWDLITDFERETISDHRSVEREIDRKREKDSLFCSWAALQWSRRLNAMPSVTADRSSKVSEYQTWVESYSLLVFVRLGRISEICEQVWLPILFWILAHLHESVKGIGLSALCVRAMGLKRHSCIHLPTSFSAIRNGRATLSRTWRTHSFIGRHEWLNEQHSRNTIYSNDFLNNVELTNMSQQFLKFSSFRLSSIVLYPLNWWSELWTCPHTLYTQMPQST